MISAPVASPLTSGATLKGTSVQQISSAINTDRNATVEIVNYSRESLTEPRVYCYSGDATSPLPPLIHPATREAAAFSKSSNAACGCVFVFSYELACARRFAVLVSVPADQSGCVNQFGATFVDEDDETDYDLYNKMLYDSQYSGRRLSAKEGKPLEIRWEDYTITVTMTDAGKSLVKVIVFRDYVQEGEAAKTWEWVAGKNGEHPENAVVGGWEEEGRSLLVVRAYIHGVLTPGKLHANIGSSITACIPFDGKEHYVDEYEVLAAEEGCFEWMPSSGGYRHPKAVVGGKSVDGKELLVGRVQFHGGMHPGKINPRTATCSISFDKQELHFKDYEILIRR